MTLYTTEAECEDMQRLSVREVIETARAITGHSIPTVPGPRRPGDPATLVASSEKIRSELGWQPLYPDLDAIIESAWLWHQQNPLGYATQASRIHVA